MSEELSIGDIRALVRDNKVTWTLHTLQRIEERGLTRDTDEQLHVVLSAGDRKVHIISAYRLDPDKWETDMKTRKEV